MQKGQSYTFNKIEQFATNNNYQFNEHDFNNTTRLGISFIVLEHEEKDIVISFVLSGATSIEYIYECVYSDK